MPNISLPEIMVVGLIALIVFGPQRLPEIARTVGRTLNELKKQASEVRAEFQSGLAMDEEVGPEDEPTPPTEPGLPAEPGTTGS